MRIFVSEFLTCGACSEEDLPESLLREGLSMLQCVLEDCQRIPDCQVVTTWDQHLDQSALKSHENLEIITVLTPYDEELHFRKLAAESDRTYVIAPEFENILAERRKLVESSQGSYAGPPLEIIELGSDKMRFAEFVTEHGFRAIETKQVPLNDNRLPFPYPIVVKPRDGAGSQNTFLLQSEEDWKRVSQSIADPSQTGEMICQPYEPGIPVSVGLIALDNQELEILPVVHQLISDDGRFQYLGGKLPMELSPQRTSRLHENLHEFVRLLPDWQGYMSIDLILPESESEPLIFVELNPRLSTSFIGYRRLTTQNLTARILFPDRDYDPLVWNPGPIHFLPDGQIQ